MKRKQNPFFLPLLIFVTLFSIQLDANVNTVILRKGDSIVGQVIGQNAERIQVRVDSGKVLEISKKTILKVLYKEISKREEEAIRKKEENKISEKHRLEEENRLKVEKFKSDELERIRKERESTLSSESSYPKEKIGFMSSYKIYKSYPSGILFLASPEAKCKPFAQSSDWYILFGAIAITTPDMNQLLPKGTRTIQVRYETSWLDIGTTMLGAILISMTRKTLYIDVCEEKNQPKFVNEEELNLEREIENKLELETQHQREKQELEENIRLEIELRKIERMRGK